MQIGAPRLSGIRARLAALTLVQRFSLAGGAVMLVSMIIIGSWVTAVISARVVESTGAATALFMDSFIAPLAQELDEADTLSIGPTRALEELLAGSAFGQRVLSIKIWKPGGLIAYAADPDLIGQRFAPSDGLARALKGHLVAELDQLDDPESEAEQRAGVPLLEVYSPIRQAWSGKVIAVAEFYENASGLAAAMAAARRQSWALVAAVTLLIGLTLFGIVHRASRVIEDQRSELERRVADSERMSRESRTLKVRAERASSRLAELNESFLKRISSELHDGPAQLIGLAALRLASLGRSRNKQDRERELAVVDGALTEAIREIRNLCKGLSLPEIDGVPIGRTVERVIRSHEARTDTTVSVDVDMPAAVPHPVAISVFRFVQEGLNNAYRHANGAGQAVRGRVADGRLTLTVSNRLDGSSGPAESATPRGLGLEGLRERVESLGGSFDFRIAPGRQAEMTMTIELDAEAFHG